jgi:hypothetical protein
MRDWPGEGESAFRICAQIATVNDCDTVNVRQQPRVVGQPKWLESDWRRCQVLHRRCLLGRTSLRRLILAE